MNIVDLAAAEVAWAMAREEVYKKDGSALPEPIARLKALATAVQDEGRPQADATLTQAIADAAARMGVAGMSPADLVRELEKRATNGDAVRTVVERCARALNDGADVLLGIRRELGGLFIAGDGPVLPEGLRVTGDASGQVNGHPIPLRHGLLLRQKMTGHRAVFSEVKPGEFVYRWVSSNGKETTEPTATSPEKWRSDTWSECADSIEATAFAPPAVEPARTPSSSCPVTSVASAATGTASSDANKPAESFVRDWAPSEQDMAKSASDITSALHRAGFTQTAVDVPRLVERFKAEKGDEPSKRPAMAFYHWALKQLKGAG